MANEVVLHELLVQKVGRSALAGLMGVTERELTQILRFELSEEEQLRLLWLIHEIASANSTDS